MKLSANDIVLKLLGLLLLTAAMLKGYQLITEPVANTDLWSNRIFLIFTVEFELALGIWLISGVFRRIAWLAATACFALFCCVTLYKAVSGYGSCGCFGKVNVNPWITLFAIDLPAVTLLAVFRPKDFNLRSLTNPAELLKPMPGLPHLASIAVISLIAIAVSTPTLAFNEPLTTTSTYEVLEPETWIGKQLPILKHIDIAEKIKTGNCLLVFYRYDCPHCIALIPKCENLAVTGNNLMITALISVPPHGECIADKCSESLLGKLSDSKKWYSNTFLPVCILLNDSRVMKIWESQTPSLADIVNALKREALPSKQI